MTPSMSLDVLLNIFFTADQVSSTPTSSFSSSATKSSSNCDFITVADLRVPQLQEFLFIGTKQQRLKFSDLTNSSLGQSVPLLAILASSLTLTCLSLIKSCHFHIRDIHRIPHLLPLSTATALANSPVLSKLDYCNSLSSGISQANLNKLCLLTYKTITNQQSTYL